MIVGESRPRFVPLHLKEPSVATDMSTREGPSQPPKPRRRSPIANLLTFLVVVGVMAAAVVYVSRHPVTTTKTVAVNPFTGSTIPLDGNVSGDSTPNTEPPTTDVTQTTIVNGFATPPQQTDDSPCLLPAVTAAQLNDATIQQMVALLLQTIIHRSPSCLHEVDTADAINVADMSRMMSLSINPFSTGPITVGIAYYGPGGNGDTEYDLTVAGYTDCAWIVRDGDGAWKFDGHFPDFSPDGIPCAKLQ